MINKLKNFIKAQILNSSIAKEALKEAKEKAKSEAVVQAFRDAHKEILDTSEEYLEDRASKKAEDKLASLLAIPSLAHLITIDKGILNIGGEKIDKERALNLRAEANMVVKSDIWQILYNTPLELSHRTMFKEGTDVNGQLTKGRAMLFLLDTQKNILEILLSVKD